MPTPQRADRLRTFGELVDLHIEDMNEVRRAPRRSKAATLRMLEARLGRKTFAQLERQLFIDFDRARAKEGAAPMTLSIDIKLVISHAIAVHVLPLSVEPVDVSRPALKRLSLVGRGVERDQRPTEDEVARLMNYFDETSDRRFPWTRSSGSLSPQL